jgi:hypothetical protein
VGAGGEVGDAMAVETEKKVVAEVGVVLAV